MVEWKKLGEVCTFNRGRTITAKDAVDGGIPVIAGGQVPSYYHNESNREGESITVAGSGAYAGFISYWNQPIFVSDAFTVDPKELLKHKYLFHWLKHNQSNVFATQKGAGVPHVHGKDIANFLIPIPSLEEQTRIVGILDTFTASIENLKEQITQRRKQYEHYRDQLLDLEGKDGVEIKSLKEIVKSYCTGATPKKGVIEYYEGGTVPWLRTQDVRFNEIYAIDSYVTNEAVEKTGIKWIPANCVIIAISGATAGRCAINKIPTTTNQHCLNLEINSEKALYKYVYYCVYNAYDKMISKKQGVRGDLNSSIILGIKIPVPSLEEQSRIVSILDTFESSIQNLEAQLKEREKQYEYYRNKLLTFE